MAAVSPAVIDSAEWSVSRSAAENQALVARHAHLVRAIAYHMLRRMPRSIEIDDLIQTGMVGLLEAAERFRGCAGSSFVSYAMQRIRGAILDVSRRSDWCSRSLRRRLRAIESAKRRIECVTGQAAKPSDIAAAVGISLQDYFCAMREFNTSVQVRLDQPESATTARAPAEPADSSHDPAEETEREGSLRALMAAIDDLPPLERRIFSLYHEQEYLMREIGDMLALSESRICQIHKQTIERLRSAIR